MLRECRKCKKIIPTRFIFDGKIKTLQNRKFCLECSPYRNHNTKPDDPARPAKIRGWKNYTEEQKKSTRTNTYKRGIDRKIKLIELKGGKCSICGYNKCNRSLSFHHKNRSTKLFGFSLNILWSKKWEDLVNEVNKCDLLCANCHMEIEDKFSKYNQTVYKDFIESQK